MGKIGLREWFGAGRAIASGDLIRSDGPGQYCAGFESRLAAMMGSKHALSVNSGTSALTAALAAAGVGPGDEVLVSAYTWIASAAAPVLVGAVPILVDVDESLTMDPGDLERKITPHTKAIIPVHMINRPCDMGRIMQIARRHDLLVIEDACQAIGVRYGDQYCGAIGDVGTFSFNQYKNMSAGEGGAIITSDTGLFARAWNYHDLGVDFRDQHLSYAGAVFVGSNMRSSEIQGAMLDVQLGKLPRRLKRMRRRYELLFEALTRAGLPVTPHHDPDNAVSLAVTFETEAEAIAYAGHRGVARLFDNSKHVYTNWDAILNKRTFHPRMDPWAWAARPIEYDLDMCAGTLDLLRRSCRVSLLDQYPLTVVRVLARALSGRGTR
ncbi:MAG: aminotransferase [Rhodobacteraceae bacterium]|nr:MAG: aminotransferase [Paracoccaceae bacterium]